MLAERLQHEESPFKADNSDITHITGTLDDSKFVNPPKFHIKMKEQSALEYVEDEVQSIMSSAKKPPIDGPIDYQTTK